MDAKKLLETKTCSICQEVKFKYKDFSISKYRNGTERIRNECKPCRSKQECERRKENIEKYKEKDKTYYLANREKCLVKNRQRRLEKREVYNAQKRKYYQANKALILRYHQKNKVKRNLRVKLHRKSNTQARLICSLRSRFQLKCARTQVLLGCSVKSFKNFLESKFDDKMTWQNYGTHWVIDHVIPLAFFNLSSVQEQFICFNWTNLQPLMKKTNMEKSCKLLPKMIIEHADFVSKFIDLNKGYQTNIDKCWWQRVKLWYGKNPNYKGDFKQLLCRIIRSWESLELSQSND